MGIYIAVVGGCFIAVGLSIYVGAFDTDKLHAKQGMMLGVGLAALGLLLSLLGV